MRYFVNSSMQAGLMGGAQAMNVNQQLIRPLLQNFLVVNLFLLPMVTMRTYSQEKQSGTIELLLTSPITDFEIVMGKFLGAMGLYIAMLALPLSSYLGSVFSGYPIKWFGVTLPAWGWADPTIKDWMSVVHLTTSWILLVSLCLHITGTIKHTLGGDRVMARMGFGGKTADTHAPATAVSAPPG